MEQIRKPFQGVLNIIRFNWHFYVIALFIVSGLFYLINFFEKPFSTLILIICILVLYTTIISLLASLYVYDLSGLYELKWLNKNNEEKLILNISAGFDETSYLIQNKYKKAELIALDFYDPEKHTEVSIKRARKAYPPDPKTKHIYTTHIDLADNSADKICVLLSAHEIRNESERIEFFCEINRILKPNGQVYVMEHLRDLSNFLAYNIGFFHFYSKSTWLRTFKSAHLKLNQEKKCTPFISIFILEKDGNTY